MALAVAAACPLASAQEDAEPEQQDLPPRALPDRDLVLRRIQANMVLRSLQSFGSMESFRDRLNHELAKRVSVLAHEFQLTDAQKTKLLMGGKGDIKRVCDRFEALERRTARNAEDDARIGELQRDIAEFVRDMQRGVFDSDSLFAKTMATTISREQRAQSHTRRREQDLARYRADIADAANTLAVALGFSDNQKRDLENLLTNEIDPPLEIGDSERVYIMCRFSQVPEAKVKPICNSAQWRLLSEIRASWATRDSGHFRAIR